MDPHLTSPEISWLDIRELIDQEAGNYGLFCGCKGLVTLHGVTEEFNGWEDSIEQEGQYIRVPKSSRVPPSSPISATEGRIFFVNDIEYENPLTTNVRALVNFNLSTESLASNIAANNPTDFLSLTSI